jgi:hypothetical protein
MVLRRRNGEKDTNRLEAKFSEIFTECYKVSSPNKSQQLKSYINKEVTCIHTIRT